MSGWGAHTENCCANAKVGRIFRNNDHDGDGGGNDGGCRGVAEWRDGET